VDQDFEDIEEIRKFYERITYQEKRKAHLKAMGVFVVVFFAVIGLYQVLSGIADRVWP
jgi:hypothetical protein